MTRFCRLPARLLTLSLLLVAAAGGPAAEASSTSAYVAELNQARASHGLHAVRVARSLQLSSYRYSRWMVRKNYFGHLATIRTSRRFSLRGEVLARVGKREPNAAAIVKAWLKSPAHRAVLLNPRYRFMGVGQARRSTGAPGATLITGHFGAR